MNSVRDFLVEIGTEELPPKPLKELSEGFSRGVFDGLVKASLIDQTDYNNSIHKFATPRRLALYIKNVATQQPDAEMERTGPAISAAFDAVGKPTQATLGFARSCGVPVEELDAGGQRLLYRWRKPGRPAKELLPDIVAGALEALPIPKRMRWGTSAAEFVRPVHWVVMLLGNEVVPAEILGITAGNETRGHRFHYPQPISLQEPAEYEAVLENRGYVLPDFTRRRKKIEKQIFDTAKTLNGKVLAQDALLDEVTALVEWPVVISGDFNANFLAVPAEALISSMQVHQKCFPVFDSNGNLMPHFIAISNIESRDPDQVRAGNERVMHPRLADAAFFWDQDRKQPLSQQLEKLKLVIFQQKLGSLWDKTQRVSALSGIIAERLGSDTRHAERAGILSKCDLLTEMVGEFPELQGVMGRYYARNDGEPEEVCRAIDEQYMPRYAGAVLPETPTGQAVAIADKLDTLVGIFGIGQIPSGTKDPYALRRAALGVLRIMIEGNLNLDVSELLEISVRQYKKLVNSETGAQVFDFMLDRLRAYYQEDGIAYDSIEAVLACRPSNPADFDKRVRAVTEFRAMPESESLAAANKRIRNILKKTSEKIPDAVDTTMLAEAAERNLAEQISRFSLEAQPFFEAQEYTPALTILTGLREPVDTFFDHVMVMTDDDRLRANRLALLNQLSALFLRVADISRLDR